MANLTPTPGWDDVTQLENSTQALGGTGGPMNLQAQALLNRTEALNPDSAGAEPSALDGTETWSLKKAGAWLKVSATKISAYVVGIYAVALRSGTGAASRTLLAILRDAPVSVGDFGADKTGANSASAAFQSAADFLTSIGGGRLRIPAGTYRLDAVVTFGNCNIEIVGDGVGVTNIGVNNATGGLLINFTALAVASPNATEFRACVSGMSFYPMVARTSGFGGSGYAVRVNRPARLLNHVIAVQSFHDLDIRNNLATPWPGSTSPQFDYGLYLRNASLSQMEKLHIDLPGAHSASCIRIDNDSAVASGVADGFYQVTINRCDLAGGRFGVYQTGWLEGLRITGCNITSMTDASVFLNGNGTTLNGSASCYNGDLLIAGNHINGQSRCIDIRNWKDLIIDSNNLYVAFGAAVGGAVQDLAHIHIDTGANGGESYHITNNYFNNTVMVNQSAIQYNAGILINASRAADYITIANNTFKMQWVGSGTPSPTNSAIHLFGQHDFVTIANNRFDSLDSLTGTAGVFYQSSGGYTQNIECVGNTFRNFYTPYYFVDLQSAQITGGRVFSLASGATKRVRFEGSNRGFVLANGLTGIDGRTSISGSTPRVSDNPWGRYYLDNASATNVTNFTNGHDGQVIDIQFTTGNTTIVHGANIFLQGSTNATFANGTHLRLRLDGNTWVEQSRRT